MFTSGFTEGTPERETSDNTHEKRVVSTETDFHTLHNILHYLYTNQITFHSKPGKESTIGPRTVDVHKLYQAADQYLLPNLKEKALDFLFLSSDIHNITARMFGESARTYDDIDEIYSDFFCCHLPSIVQTVEFEKYFDGLEGSDAHRSNTLFRKLVQRALHGKTLVRSSGQMRNRHEREQADETDDSTDPDYESDAEESDNDGARENTDEETDDDGDELDSGEESPDEEEG